MLPAFIDYFCAPGRLGDGPAEARLLQTHISYVILAGEEVYKFKKPVDFGFLDFTTLEKRKFYCAEEVRLNRRLCPEIYLGTVAVCRQKEGFCLAPTDAVGPADEVIEYGVRMARMPEEGMMGRLIAAGRLSGEHIDQIVDTLVPFYEQAAGEADIAAFGRAEAVAVNVLENFDQTETFVGHPALSRERFERISRWARAFLDRRELFDARIAAGRIRDCHGDLYSANICFAGERVYIFDCIEFNQRFRYSDVASDIAFLAMDLDYHGLEAMARRLVDRFVARSGDKGLLSVLDFYKGYRAYVRGKISLFTAADPKVDEATRNACTEAAGRYFALAERYAA